jgi:tetratricopeptide (TPR) repeat protein
MDSTYWSLIVAGMTMLNVINLNLHQSTINSYRQTQASLKQQLSSVRQEKSQIESQLDFLKREKMFNQTSAISIQEQKQKQNLSNQEQKQNLLNREKTNIDIILRAADDASQKGDHKQTIQITNSLLNNYPNSNTYSQSTDAYLYRAKAFAAIGNKDLAIKDLQQFDVLARPLGSKELNSRVTSSISNLNRCGRMQCDKNTSITPKKVSEATKIPE